ncbi:MAG: GAF domain-containing protein [Gemmataceae bacterium]|nr:GAF domain-containing protein [Gemmataceae bacterium]
MTELRVIAGPDAGQTYPLTDSCVVGRESSCPVRLSDPEVSRRHFELTRLPDGAFRAVDLGSVNGLLVNGRRVSSVDLQPGDRLVAGATLLEYQGPPGVRVLTRPGEDLGTAIVRRVDAGRAAGSLGVLYDAIRATGSILDLDQLLAEMLRLLSRAVPADRALVLLREGEGWQARATTGPAEETSISRGIIEHVARSREGIVIADTGADERFAGAESVLRAGIRAVLCVPLLGRHGDIGVLYCDAVVPDPARFTQEHLALAVAVGHQIALAVEETRYHERVVESERLAAIGQAVAALSHHIKNILQGLQSGGELLMLGINEHDDTAVQAGWRLFDKNQKRVRDLVFDMLSYSADREPVRTLTDLPTLLAEVVELVAPRAKDLGVRIDVEGDAVPPALIDREGIHRAVLNLVTNAIDAVQEAADPLVRITLRKEGGEYRIAVSDNGSGIEEYRMAGLFQPFVSTKGGRGTGLGLAVSRKIAVEHGGDIDVVSSPGQGSTFTLRIPETT